MVYRVVSGVLLSVFLAGCGGQESTDPEVSYDARYEGRVTVINPVPDGLSESAVYIQLPVTDDEVPFLIFDSSVEYQLERGQDGETRAKLLTGALDRGEKKTTRYSVSLNREYYQSFDYQAWIGASVERFYPELEFDTELEGQWTMEQLDDQLPENDALIRQVTSDEQSLEERAGYSSDYLQRLRLAALHDLLLNQDTPSALVRGYVCDNSNQCNISQTVYVLAYGQSKVYPEVEGYFVPVAWLHNHLDLVFAVDRSVTGMGVEVQY